MSPRFPDHLQPAKACWNCKSSNLRDPQLRQGTANAWISKCLDCKEWTQASRKAEFVPPLQAAAAARAAGTSAAPAHPIIPQGALDALAQLLLGVQHGGALAGTGAAAVTSHTSSVSTSASQVVVAPRARCQGRPGCPKLPNTQCDNGSCKQCCIDVGKRKCLLSSHKNLVGPNPVPLAALDLPGDPSVPLHAAASSSRAGSGQVAAIQRNAAVGRALDKAFYSVWQEATTRKQEEQQASRRQQEQAARLKRMVYVRVWRFASKPAEVHRVYAPLFPQFSLADASYLLGIMGISPFSIVLFWDAKKRCTLHEPANLAHTVHADAELCYAVDGIEDRLGWPSDGGSAGASQGPSYTGDLTPRKPARRAATPPLRTVRSTPPSSPPDRPAAKRSKTTSGASSSSSSSQALPSSGDSVRWPSSFTYAAIADGLQEMVRRRAAKRGTNPTNFEEIFGCEFTGRNFFYIVDQHDKAPESLKKVFRREPDSLWSEFAKQALAARAANPAAEIAGDVVPSTSEVVVEIKEEPEEVVAVTRRASRGSSVIDLTSSPEGSPERKGSPEREEGAGGHGGLVRHARS